MNTPVYDFIKKYSESESIRLHMPGHKGKGTGLDERFDITEIDGMDVLYQEKGLLKESQDNAASLFGTACTLYSAEGSSLSIRGMLSLIKMYSLSRGIKPVIAAGRNAHKVFMCACALLDIDVKWLYPEKSESIHSVDITPERLRAWLCSQKEKPAAVYITSPDYLGNIADIRGLSEVCKAFGVLLAVDNAHGAYLKFLPQDIHPISLGADICCDSAHKTLNALTGAGYLHISKNAPRELCDDAKKAMSLFSSTSPSFLILSSLDKLNEYLDGQYPVALSDFIKRLDGVRKHLAEKGYILCSDEPLKITVKTKPYGYLGDEFSDILRQKHIISEFSDPDYTVFMFTPEISENALDYFENILLSIERREAIVTTAPITDELKKGMSIKDALFSLSEEISILQAEGRILASPSVSCPPAIPVAVCGEIIGSEAVECFRYYGIEKIRVVKEVQ